MRSLIIAQGLERSRLLAAISIHAPNRIILLRNTNDISKELNEDVERHMDLLKKQLEHKRGFNPYPFVFELIEEKCDFFDLISSYFKIDDIIKKERASNNEIFCDISSGNKTIALSMFLACQLNNVPITYCKAAQYLTSKRIRGDLDEIALSAKEPVFLPNLPLKIDEIDYDILRIANEKIRIKSISELIRELGKNITKSELLSMSRKLDRLEEYGYIKTKREGKNKGIEITEMGRKMLKR